MRTLLVEDEQPLAKYFATGLRKRGYAVDIAFDAPPWRRCELTPYDVVVLDRDLPVLHGYAVCRQLAELTKPTGLIRPDSPSLHGSSSRTEEDPPRHPYTR